MITDIQRESLEVVVELGERMVKEKRDYVKDWDEIDIVGKSLKAGTWFEGLLPRFK